MDQELRASNVNYNNRGNAFIALTIIAFLILILNSIKGIDFNSIKSISIFLFLAVFILEFNSFGLANYGYYSIAMVIYYAVLFSYGLPIALFIISIGLLFRVIFKKYDNLFLRLADWSSGFIAFFLSGLAYQKYLQFSKSSAVLYNRFVDTANFFDNSILFKYLIGLIICSIVYLTIDVLLNSFRNMIMEFEHYEQIRQYRRNIISLYCAVIPCGFFMAVINNFASILTFLFIPILVLMNYSLIYGYSDSEINDLKEVKHRYLKTEKDFKLLLKEKDRIFKNLTNKVDETSLWFELFQNFGSSISIDSVLENIISIVKRVVSFQSCVIFLYKEGLLVPVKYMSPYSEFLEMVELLKIEESFIKKVVETKKPLLIRELRDGIENAIFKDERSIMCSPFITQNQVIGLIYFGDPKANVYNQEMMNIVNYLVVASSLALNAALLYDSKEEALVQEQKTNKELDKRNAQLLWYSNFSMELASTLHLEDTLKIILQTSRKMIPYESCIIFLLKDYDGVREFKLADFVSEYGEEIKKKKFLVREDVLGWVTANRKPLLLEDVKDSVLENIIDEERCVLIIPLIAENRVIGVIYFGSKMQNKFSEDYQKLMEAVGYQAAMAIKNAELYEKIEELAITDGLTGLYTHRYFQEMIDESVRWASRYSKPISLIFIDVDFFKQYNDTLGHMAGDDLLREISALLRSFTRESDFVCRYGGDEFVIILRDSRKEDALIIAERIREGFYNKFKTYPVKITSSIGVSNYPVDARNRYELVKKVDEAAYKSKKSGKNRVNGAVSIVEQEMVDNIKASEDADYKEDEE